MDIIQMRHNMLMNACQFSYTDATGNPISFSTSNKKTISRARVNFSPIQSGSGDASPTNVRSIVGWDDISMYHTGKNLFDASLVEQCNGYYMDADGKQLTSNVSGYTVNYIPISPATTYTISGKLCNPNSSNFRIYYYTADKHWISRTDQIRPTSGYTTFTTPSTCHFLRLQYIYSYVDFSTVQIELGSTATVYEAYSGHTPSTIFPFNGYFQDEKYNLCNEEWVKQGYYASNDTGGPHYIITDNRYRTVVACLTPGTYTFLTDLDNPYILRAWYDNTQHIITTATDHYTFTTTTYDLVAICWRNTSASEITQSLHTSIEIGSAATGYMPYRPAMYGGYIDFVSGKIWKTWERFDLTSVTSFISNSTYKYYVVTIPYNTTNNILCPIYKTISAATSRSSMANYTIKGDSNLHDVIIRDTSTTSFQDLKDRGVYFIYELETPILIGTIPQNRLLTFSGANQLWSNTNENVEITY